MNNHTKTFYLVVTLVFIFNSILVYSHQNQEAYQDQVPPASVQLDGLEAQSDQWDSFQRD